MKITIDTRSLSEGLQRVLSAVNGKPMMAILNNVLIEGGDDCIILTTSNLAYGIRCKIQAHVEDPGRTTLPVKKLATIIKSLTESSVQIDVLKGGTQAKISSGSATFRLLGMDPDEFPALPTLEGGQNFVISGPDLQQMLACVNYAQSTDEHRYILNGIYFSFENHQLTLVATDGRRLATIACDCDEREGSLIVPAKTIEEIQRLITQDSQLQIAFNERQVAITVDHGDRDVQSVYLISKIVEGNYPNYKQVIPAPSETRIRLARELFLSALQRASIVASDKAQSVKLRISENLLEISASSSEFGESHERLAIICPLVKAVEVVFNPRYLIEPLRAIHGDEVVFEFRDHFSPGVIREPEQNFLCVIMPLRIDS